MSSAAEAWSTSPIVPLLKIDEQRSEEGGVKLAVTKGALFTTWISFRKRLERLKAEPSVVVDLSEAVLVDHTVMQKLIEMERDYKESGSELVIAGLEHHRKVSNHPAAARLKPRRAKSP